MKFLCDQMLGTLAKWLRVFGFDTYFADSIVRDDKLLEISKNEDRVLITRDKELLIRAKKKNLSFIKIGSIDLDEQIKEVIKKVDIDEKLVLSRCLLCNTKVAKISKDEVMGKVPKMAFDANEEFFICKSCDKIYWKGTHYEKMIIKVKKLKKEN